MYKEIFSAAAVVLTFIIFVPYIRSVLQGRTKPQVFSWFIWALGTFVVFFVLALAALPSWFFTSNPLWAVTILTGVDLAGFGPTFRSAYVRPFQERTAFFSLAILRNVMVILALEHYSFTTALFPVAVAIACLIFVTMVLYRRRAASRHLVSATYEQRA